MEDWKAKQMAYDGSDQVIYVGYHLHKDASDTDLQWDLEKYTWNSGNCTKIQKSQGDWTNRANYF